MAPSRLIPLLNEVWEFVVRHEEMYVQLQCVAKSSIHLATVTALVESNFDKKLDSHILLECFHFIQLSPSASLHLKGYIFIQFLLFHSLPYQCKPCISRCVDLLGIN